MGNRVKDVGVISFSEDSRLFFLYSIYFSIKSGRIRTRNDNDPYYLEETDLVSKFQSYLRNYSYGSDKLNDLNGYFLLYSKLKSRTPIRIFFTDNPIRVFQGAESEIEMIPESLHKGLFEKVGNYGYLAPYQIIFLSNQVSLRKQLDFILRSHIKGKRYRVFFCYEINADKINQGYIADLDEFLYLSAQKRFKLKINQIRDFFTKNRLEFMDDIEIIGIPSQTLMKSLFKTDKIPHKKKNMGEDPVILSLIKLLNNKNNVEEVKNYIGKNLRELVKSLFIFLNEPVVLSTGKQKHRYNIFRIVALHFTPKTGVSSFFTYHSKKNIGLSELTEYRPTRFLDIHIITKTFDRETLKFQVYDFSSKPQWGFLEESFLKFSDAVFILYDRNNPPNNDSFANMVKDINKIHPGMPIIIIETKADSINLDKIKDINVPFSNIKNDSGKYIGFGPDNGRAEFNSTSLASFKDTKLRRTEEGKENLFLYDDKIDASLKANVIGWVSCSLLWKLNLDEPFKLLWAHYSGSALKYPMQRLIRAWNIQGLNNYMLLFNRLYLHYKKRLNTDEMRNKDMLVGTPADSDPLGPLDEDFDINEVIHEIRLAFQENNIFALYLLESLILNRSEGSLMDLLEAISPEVFRTVNPMMMALMYLFILEHEGDFIENPDLMDYIEKILPFHRIEIGSNNYLLDYCLFSLIRDFNLTKPELKLDILFKSEDPQEEIARAAILLYLSRFRGNKQELKLDSKFGVQGFIERFVESLSNGEKNALMEKVEEQLRDGSLTYSPHIIKIISFLRHPKSIPFILRIFFESDESMYPVIIEAFRNVDIERFDGKSLKSIMQSLKDDEIKHLIRIIESDKGIFSQDSDRRLKSLKFIARLEDPRYNYLLYIGLNDPNVDLAVFSAKTLESIGKEEALDNLLFTYFIKKDSTLRKSIIAASIKIMVREKLIHPEDLFEVDDYPETLYKIIGSLPVYIRKRLLQKLMNSITQTEVIPKKISIIRSLEYFSEIDAIRFLTDLLDRRITEMQFIARNTLIKIYSRLSVEELSDPEVLNLFFKGFSKLHLLIAYNRPLYSKLQSLTIRTVIRGLLFSSIEYSDVLNQFIMHWTQIDLALLFHLNSMDFKEVCGEFMNLSTERLESGAQLLQHASDSANTPPHRPHSSGLSGIKKIFFRPFRMYIEDHPILNTYFIFFICTYPHSLDMMEKVIKEKEAVRDRNISRKLAILKEMKKIISKHFRISLYTPLESFGSDTFIAFDGYNMENIASGSEDVVNRSSRTRRGLHLRHRLRVFGSRSHRMDFDLNDDRAVSDLFRDDSDYNGMDHGEFPNDDEDDDENDSEDGVYRFRIIL